MKKNGFWIGLSGIGVCIVTIMSAQFITIEAFLWSLVVGVSLFIIGNHLMED